MSQRNKNGLRIACSLMVAVLALAALPLLGQGVAGDLMQCDSATVALVLAAEDAYGYNWQARWQAGFAPMSAGGDMGADTSDDMSDDSSDESDDGDMEEDMEPVATEEAKLLTAKIPAVIGQDATAEPGDDMSDDVGEDTTAAQPAAPVAVPCGQLQQDVIAFIYAQNGLSGAVDDGPQTFMVGGQEIVAEYQVLLSGPQEVPGPGDADAQGAGWVNIDETTNQVCWSITLSGIDFPASAAHIHQGGEGESGPPVIPLSAPQDGAWSGCVDGEAEAVASVTANPSGFYVNVHTGQFPDGALRGQLLGG